MREMYSVSTRQEETPRITKWIWKCCSTHILYGESIFMTGKSFRTGENASGCGRCTALKAFSRFQKSVLYQGRNFTQSAFLEVNGELIEANFVDENTLLGAGYPANGGR